MIWHQSISAPVFSPGTRIIAGLCLFAVLVLLFPASAAMAQAGTPEEVVERYLAHTQAGEWEELAMLMDPEALASFGDLAVLLLSLDESGEVVSFILGEDWSVEDVRNATYAELFAKFMRFVFEYINEETAFIFDGAQVLGSVREGDNLAHVVFRTWAIMDGVRASEVDTISLRKGAEGWGVLLNSDVEAVIQLLGTMLAGG